MTLEDEGFPVTAGVFQPDFDGNGGDGYIVRLCDSGVFADPNPVDFGVVQTGNSSTIRVTFTNECGPANTAALASRIIGLYYSIDADTCSGSGVLFPGNTCFIDVTFSPSADGISDATLELDLVDNDRAVVNVTGVGNVAEPSIDVMPAALNFGDQVTGTTSAPMVVTIGNGGPGNLRINDYSIQGSNPGSYSVNQSSTCMVGTVLLPLASCTFSVTFSPNLVGLREADLVIQSNDPGGTVTVPLQGNGTLAAGRMLSVVPDTLVFGTVAVGESSDPQNVTVTNTGNVNAVTPGTIDDTSFGGNHASDFSLTHDCPAILAAMESCEVSITFSPQGTLPRSATLTIDSNADDAPHVVDLAGDGGGPILEFSRTNFDFGDVFLNSCPCAPINMTVTSVGTAQATITGVATGTESFSASSNCDNPHDIGEFCTITVSILFGHEDRGFHADTLTVNSNARGSPHKFPVTLDTLNQSLPIRPGTGGCFIATAAYGSYFEPQVETLRDFRDDWLLTNAPGRALVDLYYDTSPPVADAIAQNEAARALVRLGLAPVVRGVEMFTAIAEAEGWGAADNYR